MTPFLVILRITNLALVVTLTIVAVSSARRASGRRARTLFWSLVVVGSALTVTVAQRLVAQLLELGALPPAFRWVVAPWWQFVVSLITTVLLLGGVWLGLRVVRRLDEAERALSSLVTMLPGELPVGPDTFTNRELEVLGVLATGVRTDDEIAATLFISPHTAATHVRNIMKKSDLHSRYELTLLGRSFTEDAAEPP
jgi:DNA-binding CsgD family transcriptional regulator